MNGLRRGLQVAWPLALLMVFVVSFRRVESDGGPANAIAECEATPAGDVARLEQCLSDDPHNVELMTDLGGAYEVSGAVGRAEDIYRRALAIEPHDGDLHVRLGELLLTRGDRSAARAEGDVALRWQPGNARAARLAAAAPVSSPERVR